MTEPVGIALLDGPLGPVTNIYDLDWPAPEEIIAFRTGGSIAVAIADAKNERLATEMIGDEVYHYRRVAVSKLDHSTRNVVRGASYEHVVKEVSGA